MSTHIIRSEEIPVGRGICASMSCRCCPNPGRRLWCNDTHTLCMKHVATLLRLNNTTNDPCASLLEFDIHSTLKAIDVVEDRLYNCRMSMPVRMT